MNAERILTSLDRVTDTLPLLCANIEKMFKTRLYLSQGSNDFFTVREGHSGSTRIEVREPTAQSLARGKNGMLLIDLESSIQLSELEGRFGERQPLSPQFQRPGRPVLPTYAVYTKPWGELRLGFSADEGNLVQIVVDANM